MLKSKLGVRLVVLIICLCMVVSFVGCNTNKVDSPNDIKKDTTQENKDTEKEKEPEKIDEFAFPVTDKDITLSWWYPLSEDAASVINSWNENLVFATIEERTGITLEFESPPQAQAEESYNLMIASDQVTDIIDSATSYKGGIQKAIDDGYYLKLNDYLEEYGQDYLAVINETEAIYKDCVTENGDIGAFARVIITEPPSWAGTFIRKDWLDDMGLTQPVILDEWEKVLYAFKDREGCEVPLLLSKPDHWTWNSNSSIFSAFDISYDFINKDGKAVYGPYDPAYKDFLTLMNKWYNDKIIDQDFATRSDKSFKALLSGNKGGAAVTSKNWVKSAAIANEELGVSFDMIPVPAPKLTADQTIKIRNAESRVPKHSMRAISATTKHPEYAVQLFNYFYTDEGYLLTNFGVEGETYTIEDKEPYEGAKAWLKDSFKNKTITMTDTVLNNPELSPSQVNGKYRFANPPTLQTWNSWLHLEGNEFNAYCNDEWQKDDKDYVMPNLIFTADEEKSLSSTMNDVKTYVDEMTLKFIIGLEPLDKFDDYIAQLEQLGVENAIKIQQDSLDRYLAK